MPFEVFFTNIPDRGCVGEFDSLDAAIAGGKALGFEFHVKQDGRTLCGFDLFRGLISFEDPAELDEWTAKRLARAADAASEFQS